MTGWASESSPLNTTLPLLTTCSSVSLVMFLTPGRRSHMLSAGLLRAASITCPACWILDRAGDCRATLLPCSTTRSASFASRLRPSWPGCHPAARMASIRDGICLDAVAASFEDALGCPASQSSASELVLGATPPPQGRGIHRCLVQSSAQRPWRYRHGHGVRHQLSCWSWGAT